MSETVSVDITIPITGDNRTVEVVGEEDEYVLIESDETFDGYQLTCRNPEYADEMWFELSWTMERENGDETSVETDGEVTLFCPNCGSEVTVSFTQDEFEELRPFCSSCGDDVNVIRDQPTESGQAHVINYIVHLY